MKKILVLVAVMLVSSNAMAEFDKSKLYAGGAVGMNRIGDEGTFGFRGFAGYDLKEDVEIADNIGMAAELGYDYSKWSDFGDFKVQGLWAAAVLSIGINDEMNLINRIGYSFANKNYDGIITGLGLDYHVDEKITVRGELVMQGYKSYQVGALYRF